MSIYVYQKEQTCKRQILISHEIGHLPTPFRKLKWQAH